MEEEKVEREKGLIERVLDWGAAQLLAIETFLVAIAGFIFGIVIAAFRGLEKFVGYLVKLLPEDPFDLRIYGDSLLSPSVRSNLRAYTRLLAFSLAFELFAWSNMWGYTGVESIALWVLPAIFAGMVILLDRGMLTMDDPRGGTRFRVVVARASMLVLLSLITAVPVELRVFSPEIDRVVWDAEKVQVDAIRTKAKAYEADLAERQKDSVSGVISADPDDVVARRLEERAALVTQQSHDRAEITRRITAASAQVVDEVGNGTYTRGHQRGAGETTVELRRQERQTREELRQFNADAREQLVAFDAETERMRTGSVKTGTDEIARRDTSLLEKLREVDVMPAEQLAAAYGGEYKQPNGFLARYRILLTLVEGDSKNQGIVWGCRLVMVLFGLTVLFVKFVMTNEETAAYFSLRAQALSGNGSAINALIVRALAGDAEAVAILRMVAEESREASKALGKLGYSGNVETAGWVPDAVAAYSTVQAAQRELNGALVEYRIAFRELCARRSGNPPAALLRDRLAAEAELLWNHKVQPMVSALAAAEGAATFKGVRVPGWPVEFDEPDPRAERSRLWDLPDYELVTQFGWSAPSVGPFRGAAEA